MQTHITRTQAAGSGNDSAADEDFARDDGGDESLRQVPKPVVIVAAKVEVITYPIEKRNVFVGVMRANQQNDRVVGD